MDGEGTERSFPSPFEANKFLRSKIEEAIKNAIDDGAATDSYEDRVEVATNTLIGFSLNGKRISLEAARGIAINII